MNSSSNIQFDKESWHYTKGEVFLKQDVPLVLGETSDLQDMPPEVDGLLRGFERKLVFYNGNFIEHLSTENLSDLNFDENNALEVENPIDAESDHKVEKPFSLSLNTNDKDINCAIVFLYGNRLSDETKAFRTYQRNSIKIEGSGQANLFELHIALNEIEFFSGNTLRVDVAKESHLQRFRYFWVGGEAYLYDHSETHLSEASQMKNLTFVTGGKWTRFNENTYLNGELSDASLKHMCLLGSGQQSDLFSKLHHKVGKNEVAQEHKSLLTGKSKSSFTGMIAIEQDAQKASANQISHNLVLTDDCEVNTRPQLQVEADDVKANHGATVGQISDEEVFYLQSRAIGKKEAQRLVTKGLVFSCLGLFDDGILKKTAEKCLQASLAQFSREASSES